jgi:hypothetical protein
VKHKQKVLRTAVMEELPNKESVILSLSKDQFGLPFSEQLN